MHHMGEGGGKKETSLMIYITYNKFSSLAKIWGDFSLDFGALLDV